MEVVNVYAGEWDEERDRAGLRVRLAKVGARLGGERLGATLWELLPGQRTIFHCHHANEELLLVVDGEPVVRTTDGERSLVPGDVTIFRRGAEGMHGLLNRTDEPVRFLFVSTMSEPDVIEFPDSGKIGVFAGAAPRMGFDAPLELFLRADARVGYYDGEVPEDG